MSQLSRAVKSYCSLTEIFPALWRRTGGILCLDSIKFAGRSHILLYGPPVPQLSPTWNAIARHGVQSTTIPKRHAVPGYAWPLRLNPFIYQRREQLPLNTMFLLLKWQLAQTSEHNYVKAISIKHEVVKPIGHPDGTIYDG